MTTTQPLPLRLLRAAASATVILAILGGVPVLGWLFGRGLWASVTAGRPISEFAVTALTRPDDGRLLVGLVALVAVAAWAVLAYSITAEFAAVLARRPTPAIDLPVFRGSRTVATILVGALLGVGSAPALAAPSLPVATVAAPHHDVAAVDESDTATRSYTVRAGDSLWRIAEEQFGDPRRWREIYRLNHGREQADGARVNDADLLQVGWTLLLPDDTSINDSQDAVTVRTGDTLSEIADDELGDPARAQGIFTANRDRPQPHGGRLTDPDHIEPGWRLHLPDRSAQPEKPEPPTEDDQSEETDEPDEPEKEQGQEDQGAGEESEAIVVPTSPSPPPSATPSTPQRSPEVQQPGSPRTTSPQPTSATPGPGEQARETGEDSGVGVPVGITAGSLVLAGFAAALLVRRRRQLRARRAGHRIALPDDPDAGRYEWQATQAEAEMDVAFLDTALRGLALTDWTDAAVPALRTVTLETQRAWLDLREPAAMPNPPFASETNLCEYRLEATAALPLTHEEATGRCAPYPALVSVATDPEQQILLVDLEEIGVAHLTGATPSTLGLLRHIAAELATAVWAQDMEIIVVGFGNELAPLNTDRLRVAPDLATGITLVRSRIREAEHALDDLGEDALLAARLREDSRLAWAPVILLATGEATDDDRAALDALAATLGGANRRPAAVILTGITLTGTEIHIREDGALVMPGIGDGWRAEHLPAAIGQTLASVIATTAQPDQPAPPASEDASWATDMTEDGRHAPAAEEDPPEDDIGLLEEVSTNGAAPAPSPPTAGPAAVTGEPEPPAVDPEAVRRLGIVDHQDPGIDADLDRWHADDPERPLLGILGTPQVRAPGIEPAHRLPWNAEILVYLALRPVGATPDQMLTDLWSEGRRVHLSTLRAAVHIARRWAGTGLDGDPEAPFLSEIRGGGTYRLTGHLTDWDLFRRLRKRAQARHAAHHPGAIPDYEAARALVRGPILQPLRKGGWAWLRNYERIDLQIPGYIVDTMHELVDIALTDDDTELARRAAETARLVDPGLDFDRPLLDLMRIAHAEDRAAELERHAEALLAAHDPSDELDDDTFDLLNELTPNLLRHRP